MAAYLGCLTIRVPLKDAETCACADAVQLLDLIDHNLLDDDIILLAAPALARVLSSKPEVSVDVLQRCEALGSLAAALKGQAHAAAVAARRDRNVSEVIQSLHHGCLMCSGRFEHSGRIYQSLPHVDLSSCLTH